MHINPCVRHSRAGSFTVPRCPFVFAQKVLSDPQKRELYDQLGETGMMMMEDPYAAAAAREVKPSQNWNVTQNSNNDTIRRRV